MNGNSILSCARAAVLCRLSSLGRRFCEDDVNEMVSMTIERFYLRGSYDPSLSSPKTYISRIASSVVYDFVKGCDKGKKIFMSLDEGYFDEEGESVFQRDIRFADSRGTDSALLESEREALVGKAMEKLSERQRTIFNFVGEGLHSSQMAPLLGTTPSRVAVEASKMKSKLRDILGEVA